jgi:RND family efflux transporter MFP subunit
MKNNRRTRTAFIAIAAVGLAALLIFALIKSRAGEEDEEVVPDMAVHVGAVGRATLHRLVTAYGSVIPDPGGGGRIPAEAEVSSATAGIVARVDVLEGQKVAKGTVLFHLDSRVADVALEKAVQALAFAEANYERQKKLLTVDGTSRKAFQEAEQQLNDARSERAAAETAAALLRIQAPLDGTVVKINVKPGEAVELNTVLAAVVDLDRLVAAVNVPSREAALVKAGQPVRLEAEGPGSSAVTYVGSRNDEKTDTIPVRISIPAGSEFRPGRYLSVQIVCEEKPDCLVVPEVAVIADSIDGSTGMIVMVEGEKAVHKPVKIGLREGGLIEVEGEGLEEGQVIVTEEAYALTDDMKIHRIQSETGAR